MQKAYTPIVKNTSDIRNTLCINNSYPDNSAELDTGN